MHQTIQTRGNGRRSIFLGDDLLVSPITRRDVQSWPVYLPAGEWVDASSALFRWRIPVYIRLHRAEELLPRFRLADLQVAHLG
jgi:hypothetical protein